MIYTEAKIDDKVGYIIPIGDVHLGDINFTPKAEKKLRGYIQWVVEHPNARVILMGDIFNVAATTSKTSTFSRRANMKDNSELAEAVDIFSPIKEQIVVAYDGNHEDRAIQWVNESPTLWLCHALGVKYGGYSGVTVFHVNKNKRKDQVRGNYRERYSVYAHHTTGGGGTVGGKMNRVDKLRQIVCNADIYLGGHNHMLGNIPVKNGIIDISKKQVKFMEQWLVDCGSYQDWNGGYAEAKQMVPSKLGSPKIQLEGTKHDIHVSL